jgi:tripartite-type tricarboxylate transporter receptor subunit TctC
MPPAVAARINAALVAGLNRDGTANSLRDLGAEPNRMTPADYAALVRGDIARWGQLVREANITAT